MQAQRPRRPPGRPNPTRRAAKRLHAPLRAKPGHPGRDRRRRQGRAPPVKRTPPPTCAGPAAPDRPGTSQTAGRAEKRLYAALRAKQRQPSRCPRGSRRGSTRRGEPGEKHPLRAPCAGLTAPQRSALFQHGDDGGTGQARRNGAGSRAGCDRVRAGNGRRPRADALRRRPAGRQGRTHGTRDPGETAVNGS